MQKKLFSYYQLVILRRPVLTLLVTFLILAWLASHLPNFKLDASADSLVLEGDKDLEYSRQITKRYGSEDFLLVTYSPEQDLLSAPVLAEIDKLRLELAELEGVSSVVTILDVPLLESPLVSVEDIASGQPINSLRNPQIDKALVRKELSTSPLYKNLLTSTDNKTTALQVNLERDERYIELLEHRENLRALKQQSGWSDNRLSWMKARRLFAITRLSLTIDKAS